MHWRISRSLAQSFQEMSCIKTRSHKRGPIADHHREDFFAALVNYGDLVEVNNSKGKLLIQSTRHRDLSL